MASPEKSENSKPLETTASGDKETGLPRNVKILGGASMANDVASEMVYPLLPAFLTVVLGGNRLHLGILEGVAESLSSLLKLGAGGWSDRLGKRRGLVLLGYILAVVVRPLIAFSTAFWQLFLVRIVDRLGKGIRTAPRDAMIADSTPEKIRGRAFGFHRAMDHLGAALGPLLAIAILLLLGAGSDFSSDQPESETALRTIFFLALFPGLLVLALLIFGLKETERAPDHAKKEPFRLTLQPFDRHFRLYLLALVLFTLGNTSDLFLLERARELGVPVFWLPALWCAFHLVKSSGNWLLGWAVDRVGSRPFLFLGWLVYAGIYLAFALATSALEAWIFFLCYALFYALTEPAERTLVANLAPPEHKGLAFGWFHFAIGIVTLPANLIFGALYHNLGAMAAFAWSAGAAFLACLILLGVKEKKLPATSQSV